MKKYLFKLDPVLKLRKLKEENCRMELGKLISFLSRIEDQIKHDTSEIQNYYKIQEASLQNGVRGDQVQAFPMLIAAKEKNIELLHRDKKEQEGLIDLKKKELAILRGELKVLENLKEKDFDQYKKALNKEIDQKVEEQTQNWLQFNERKV
jgi:flagellar FliJ protein